MSFRSGLWSVRRWLSDQDGATATEYSVMLALILLAVIATLVAYGNNLNTRYVDIDSTLFP